jgi:hypothetical protein
MPDNECCHASYPSESPPRVDMREAGTLMT